jgi:transposase-like protein
MDGQANVREMVPTPKPPVRDVEVPPRARRRQFTVAYKQRILEEAERCTETGEIGALLRREGLYSSTLSKWRQQRDEAVKSALDQKPGRKPADPLSGEVNRLRRENARLKQNLERAEKVIEVQGKVSALLRELSLGSTPEKPTP